MKLNALEKAILDYVANRNSDPALKAQISAVEVIRRKYTGAGIYVYFSHPKKEEALKIKSLPGPYSGPSNITSSKLEHGAGSLVWYDDDGYLSCIEIYSYSNDYPKEEYDFKFVISDK
jgi:hypothetical protein